MARRRRQRDDFAVFFAAVEPRLRTALVASYGAVDGRAVTVDALSWAWEHWDDARSLSNPVAYLYRVGQSALRKYTTRPLPIDPGTETTTDDSLADVSPELMPALGKLSEQQRTVVLLVHGFGWSQREVASLLDISASTVREHLDRAMARLRADLEVRDVT
jgi:RNA polymerase sigma factor (sigma-70 family)